MKTNQRIVAISILTSILLVSAVQANVFADEPIVDTDAAGGLSLQTVFHFREGEESISTFKVFGTESSGFTRSKALSFKLEGIIGWDRPLLYKAINEYYEYGRDSKMNYGEFDVDITFSRAGEPFRSITYADCQVKSYDVQTLTDAEEGYHGATKFAYIDSIKFDCRGFTPHNPVYAKMIKEQYDAKTSDARENFDHEKELKKTEEALKAQYVMQSQLTTQYFDAEKLRSVPSWVEQNSRWLSEGKITAEEYQNMIQYLVLKEIL